jgi:hypothetical protein
VKSPILGFVSLYEFPSLQLPSITIKFWFLLFFLLETLLLLTMYLNLLLLVSSSHGISDLDIPTLMTNTSSLRIVIYRFQMKMLLNSVLLVVLVNYIDYLHPFFRCLTCLFSTHKTIEHPQTRLLLP